METPDFNPIPEILPESLEQFFEASTKMATEYVSLIENFTGNPSLTRSSELPVGYETAGRRYFEHQKEHFERHSLTATGLLSQRFKDLPSELADPTSYELQELSPGVFVLHLNDDIYRKLKSGAQGVAINVKDGTSFVMVPRYKDPSFETQHLKENIPHEVHHLLWRGIREAGLVISTEVNASLQTTFLTFQDELLARMASGGYLAGYNFLSCIDPEIAAEVQNEEPELFKEIGKKTSDLNEFLEELMTDLRERNLSSTYLIGAVIKATSYQALKDNLFKIKEYILTLPVKISTERPSDVRGWGSV